MTPPLSSPSQVSSLPRPAFRLAVATDIPLILDFIHAIARYEKMEEEVQADEAMLHEVLFERKLVEVLFVLEGEKEVGFALYFHNFSTFVGRKGLYLEDLYVLPEYRGKGYGKGLFMELVRKAVAQKCGRMEWVCLNWNKPSIDFYRSLGARPMDEWTTYRLTEEQLQALAEEESRL